MALIIHDAEVTMTNEPYRCSITIDVRWRDLDAMQHVNNAVYFTYLEQARVHYLTELGLTSRAPSEIGFILAEASCQFRSPLELGERATVHIRVSSLGRASFVFDYRVEADDGRLVAEARTTQVHYDYEGGRSVPLTESWRKAILSFESGLSSRFSEQGAEETN